uniref:Transient receptor potential cation channel subfamily M member 3-like n=1 Tax=Saccoglossus kowalevskii TaxID=10224 RepID=A0ABM0M8S9_SACKO|nr:PREDICTED: transient receptor potential cation channel subfamily M member 3-like [Saccoglossus kowalevskii]
MQWVGGKVKRTLRCLGIASWGYTEDHDCLISPNSKGLYPANYKVNPVIKRNHPVPLNPEHTHFILVDDGTDLNYSVELNLRAEIEKIIAAPINPDDPEGSGLGVPVAMLLVEGGVDAIRTVCQAISRGIPTVICEGTGRAADILAYAHNNCVVMNEVRQIKPSKISTVKEKLKSAYGNEKSDEQLKDVLKNIQTTVSEEKLLTVFDMDCGENADMDLAILTALLKGAAVNWQHQIELALSWNCIDVARERIFSEDNTWKGEQLHDFMTAALVDDKVDFVQLFLENGVIMQEYLTVSRLRYLYNSCEADSNFRKIMRSLTNSKKKGPFTLRDVGQCIRKIVGAHYEPLYLRDRKFRGTRRDVKALVALSVNLTGMGIVHKAQQEYLKSEKMEERHTEEDDDDDDDDDLEYLSSFQLTNPGMNFEKPYRELFIWAVLMGRMDLAEFLWEYGDEAISSAIAAVKIFSDMAYLMSNPEDKQSYLENAKKFEQLAVNVLDESYNCDETLAGMLIERRHTNWGGMNILNMAAEAGCKAFVSHPCCQNLLNQIWQGGICSSPTEVILASIFPPWLLNLKYKDNTGEVLTRFQKTKIFINAPVAKFWGGTFLYIIFLLWYSYAILFNFGSTPDIGDILLFGWICTLMVEEFRQSLIPEEHESVDQNLKKWASSWWNIMDFLSIALAISGFTLRWFEPTFEAARALYAVNCSLFILRIMRMFSLNSTLGPKLIMIGKMLIEMMLFLVILLVFLISYGVASQALLYPNRRTAYWGIFRDVVYMPYFQIYGELFLEELDPHFVDGENPVCDASSVDPTQSCSTGHPLVPLLLAGYLIVGNVLLLNLLIAIFSFVFEEIQTNSLQVWKYDVYQLVMEFDDRPPLAPPFIIFSHIYLLFKWFFRRMKKRTVTAQTYSSKHLEILWLLEKDSAASYRKKKMHEEKATIEEKINKIEKKLDMILKYNETKLQKKEMRREGRPRKEAGRGRSDGDDQGRELCKRKNSQPATRNGVGVILPTISKRHDNAIAGPSGHDVTDGHHGNMENATQLKYKYQKLKERFSSDDEDRVKAKKNKTRKFERKETGDGERGIQIVVGELSDQDQKDHYVQKKRRHKHEQRDHHMDIVRAPSPRSSLRLGNRKGASPDRDPDRRVHFSEEDVWKAEEDDIILEKLTKGYYDAPLLLDNVVDLGDDGNAVAMEMDEEERRQKRRKKKKARHHKKLLDSDSE